MILIFLAAWMLADEKYLTKSNVNVGQCRGGKLARTACKLKEKSIPKTDSVNSICSIHRIVAKVNQISVFSTNTLFAKIE